MNKRIATIRKKAAERGPLPPPILAWNGNLQHNYRHTLGSKAPLTQEYSMPMGMDAISRMSRMVQSDGNPKNFGILLGLYHTPNIKLI